MGTKYQLLFSQNADCTTQGKKDLDCIIPFRTVAYIYALEQFQRKCHIFKLHVPQPYLIETHHKSFGAMSPCNKSICFVLGYNGSARAVRIYHIKNPRTKKGVVVQRGFGTLETLESISLITHICAFGFCVLNLIILQYCPFSPRGFCCGTSRADPQTPPLSVQEQLDQRGSGARSPVKPQSHCDIQHCRELLTAHQCLVECFVYNLIQ